MIEQKSENPFETHEIDLNRAAGRPENPLIEPLTDSPYEVERFTDLTNCIVSEYNGIPISPPVFEVIETRTGAYEIVKVDIEHNGMDESKSASLRNHLGNLTQSTNIRIFGNPNSPSGLTTETKHHPVQPGYHFGRTEKKKILLLNMEKLIDQDKVTSIVQFARTMPELELAYDAVTTSLILAGQLDFSSHEKMAESLGLRQEIFMKLYHSMLKDMIPPASRNSLLGLDEQVQDIETNLYSPLNTGKGNPMNTLLVGAPGVGKSMAGRHFAFEEGVITIPLSVDQVADSTYFDHVILPKVTKYRRALQLPTVILLDDVEVLLEAGLTVDQDGRRQQYIDPKKRSEALSILERLQDTHQLYLLCTLNHPDVDSAFLRRFNPVYFPLPGQEQREESLRKFIPTGPLDDVDYEKLICELSSSTDGFNYSGLSLIPEYAANTIDSTELTGEDYKNAIEFGLIKARQRTNVYGLSEFDKQAREMIVGKE